MVLEGSLFYCKLITPARLINTANEVKKTSVCLFFDASHVQGLGVCDNDEEVIPSCVKSAFVKQASSTSAADLMSIRFVLKGHAPLVAPDSMLQKRPSMFKDIEALLRMGRSDTFKVYLPSSAVSRKHLLGLSDALARGMKPAPENVINSIYRKPFKSKIVTRLDELWGLNEPENPPPYDLSTVPGASNDEPSSQSDFRDTSSSGKRGKRRMASPVSRQTPSKRQFLTEKADPEPWELAFAAQGAQIAALCAELHTLREEMQRFRRASMVDAETQTDPPAEAEAKPGSSLDYASPSQASTVENTIEDRLLMVEDSILEEQKQRALLDEKLDHTDKQIRQELESECFGLQSAVENLESRVDDLESCLQDDLRQDFKEDIDAKASDLQVKLEEFIERRLEDVEEVVKHDVRMAFENASCKFKIDLGWSE
ncbi:hypothetical protein KCU99_g3563, partial [Aureobasidium melanogenum]